MATNAYGSDILGGGDQTYGNAQTVIDTAVMVWMQMGLTENQILYGIAMMNEESGYDPVVTNGKPTDTIRGLGQFSNPTWRGTAQEFDLSYGLQPGSPDYVKQNVSGLTNRYFSARFVADVQGSNAQAGVEGDPTAGYYDPAGLVTQLTVIGQGILDEWRQASSANDTNMAQQLVSEGVNGASLLVPDADQSAESKLLATVALAYMNHHQGAPWWKNTPEGNSTHIGNTIARLNDGSLVTAINHVLEGFQAEQAYLADLQNTSSPSDLIVGDPWVLANATPSVSDGVSAPLYMTHDIPSLFPGLDNFMSQTVDGLASYTVSRVTQKPKHGLSQVAVSYTYTTNATQANDIVSGSSQYSFVTHLGQGTENIENGDSVSYSYSNAGNVFRLQESEIDPLHNVISTENAFGGAGFSSQVDADGPTVRIAFLFFPTLATQSAVQANYDSSGNLASVLLSASNSPYQKITVGDAVSAQQLALQYGVPLTDPYVTSLGDPNGLPQALTTVNALGVKLYSTGAPTAGSAAADPGFQAEAVVSSGDTLRWSFNADGTIGSRDLVDSSGNVSSENFDSAGHFTGTSVTTTNSDGSVVTQTFDTSGATTGFRVATPFDPGTTVTINGQTTTYANGCTITVEYGPGGTATAPTGFSVSSTADNPDGSETTTEMNYLPVFDGTTLVTDQFLGSTVTVAGETSSTSTDFDASGNVLGSRLLTVDAAGSSTTMEQLNAAGTSLGSSTLSIDGAGDVLLQSFDPADTLTSSKSLSTSGVLTDTEYQGGVVASVSTSEMTQDGGNLTTYEDANGNVTGDSWARTDGSYGTDTVQPSGEITGIGHYADGSSATSVNDGQGHITATDLSSSGTATGTADTTAAAGTVTTNFTSSDGLVTSAALTELDGTIQATTAAAGGGTVGVSIDPNGMISRIVSDGQGTTTAQLLDSDGNVSGSAISVSAADGSVTTTDFDTTGAETGYSQESTSDGVTTSTQYATTDGTATETGYTQSVVNADGSITTTDYSVANGVATETDYTQTTIAQNGDTTSIAYAPDSNGDWIESGSTLVSVDSQGQVTESDFGPDGTLTGYETERVDGGGNVLVASYDSTGSELSSSSIFASGVVQSDILDSLSGTVATTWQADGSYQQVTNDGSGDTLTANYSANGAEESDTWAQADGSSGYDTVNSDGSVSSVSNDGEGNLTTTTQLASGAITGTTDFYAHGPQSATSDTHNTSWDLLGSQQVDVSSDGLTATTSSFDQTGTLLGSQTVVRSDGGLDVTTSNFDGSGNLLNYNTVTTSADGSSVTTTDYNGSGTDLGSTVVTTSADGLTTTTLRYDGSGDLLGGTAVSTTAGSQATTTTDTDASGNVTDYTVATTSADGSTETTSRYSGSGQLLGQTVAVTSTDGLTTTTSNYDGSGNVLGTSTSVTSSDGLTQTTTNQDSSGAVTGSTTVVSSADSGTLVTATYDANDALVSQQIAYSDDIEPGDVLVSAALVDGDPTLLLTEPNGSVPIANGLLPDAEAATGVSFDEAPPLSLLQFVQQAAGFGNAPTMTVAGAAGNLIFGAVNGGSITAGSGDDTISSWGNQDTLVGGAGSDLVYAYGDGDKITAGDGNDTIDALGAGATLVGGSGVDTLIGGAGNDTFIVNNTADVIQAAAASDTIESSVSYTLAQNVDTLQLTGTSSIVGTGNSAAANLITGNSGNDTLVAGSGSDTLVAGSGIDTLVTGSGNDLLEGRGGDTYELSAGFGNSEITTSAGSATLELGAGLSPADLTFGMTLGADGSPALLIQDGTGSVTVDGGLTGTIDAAVLSDGSQVSLSQLLASGSAVSSTITGATGDLVFAAAAADSIVGGFGDDTLIGAMDDDTLVGGTGDQQLYGIGSGDVLVGGAGQDTLHGESSDETFIGGTGNTLVEAGPGANTYALTQGGTLTIDPSGAATVETLLLPAGMSIADFTSYSDLNGDLIVQSLSGDTTAVIRGFSSSAAFWQFADSTEALSLRQWSGSIARQAPPSGSYQQEIDGLRAQYSVDMGTILNGLGASDESIENPNSPGAPNEYKFDGVATQNISGDGIVDVGSSESDVIQTYPLQETVTETFNVPVFQTFTHPGVSFSESLNDPEAAMDFEDLNTITQQGPTSMSVSPSYANGQQTGWNFSAPASTDTEQVGTRTVTRTVTIQTEGTDETRGFTDYNIKLGNSDDSLLDTGPPFVGTVDMGNGDDFVDLGLQNSPDVKKIGPFPWYLPGTESPGAFIQAGDGNDTIYGTGGADTIAAGLGMDSLVGATGSTFYVPLQGDSLDYINTQFAPYYGTGPYPHNTLVLPEGVTPESLQYRVLSDPNQTDGPDTKILQLSYGDATVLAYFDAGAPSWQAFGSQDYDTDGINYFQFADGTVLNRDQVLAMATAGPTDSAPVVSAANQRIAGGQPISTSGFFSGTDSTDSPILWYQITNSGGANGGNFVLNGVVQQIGRPFYVDAADLSQLTYVGGDVGSTDSVQVAAFDGVNLSSATVFDIYVETGAVRASGPDQTVSGPADGPDTLIGGYGGDRLSGNSGQDTFDYGTGGGQESIQELGSGQHNAVQFGAGIAPGSLQLGASTDSTGTALILSLDGGDSLSVPGFDAFSPFDATSLGVQAFNFADGTSLSLSQLLNDADVAGGSFTLTNFDGSYNVCTFTPGAHEVYSFEFFSAAGAPLSEEEFGQDGAITQINYQNTTNADGSTDFATSTLNPDGSTSDVDVHTPAGGGATTIYTTDYDPQGRNTLNDTSYPDGSQDNWTYVYGADGSTLATDTQITAAGATSIHATGTDAQGNVTLTDTTNPDGSQDDWSLTYYSGGSLSSTTETQATADGATTTNFTAYDTQGDITVYNTTNPDGSQDDWSLTYYSGGSLSSTTEAQTAADGATTTYFTAYDTQGDITVYNTTNPDGSTDDTTNVYNSDGSGSSTEVATAADGAATTYVTDYDAQGLKSTYDITNPDSSTDDSTYTYSADGSSITQNEVLTPAASNPVTTIVSQYDGNWDLLAQNSYTPATDGSYEDDWSNADGGSGQYWWHAASLEYQQSWTNSDGTSWTDDYQFAAGGSPGGTGVSFTETYSDSAGDQGTRQFDASTGVTSLSWYSSSTGTTLSGTTTDSGFIGLQNDGQLTNTQPDLTFFNPNVSASFSSFLAGH